MALVNTGLRKIAVRVYQQSILPLNINMDRKKSESRKRKENGLRN